MEENKGNKQKIHHCFNCGAEVDDDPEYIGNAKIYCCVSNECAKELRYQRKVADNEVRWKAEEDDYDRYRY